MIDTPVIDRPAPRPCSGCAPDFVACAETGEVVGSTIQEQTIRVCENVKGILEAAGLDFSHVVKTTCFLADIGDFAAFNAIYGEYFTGKPARSCVAVKDLPKGVLCEIEVIVAK